jgi:hypothetical protein
VASRGELFAVEDFARDVPSMTPAQAEAAIAGLVRVSGVAIRNNPNVARAACALDRGLPAGLAGDQPQFVMRWQDADLNHLPRALEERLASGHFRGAAVGSCPARSAEGAFTAYRFAVLLY